MDQPATPYVSQARFELIEEAMDSETAASSPRMRALESPPAPLKSSSTPIPSTETNNIDSPSALPSAGHKKKGTAATVKRAPKRRQNGESKKTKKARTEPSGTDAEDVSGDDAESDNGPYCLCRGPDDHRWMIFCENCEDWFHGECVDLNKEIGENLVEKFICPNCSDGKLATIYKKTCAHGNCRKPSRLAQEMQSVFCSNEHAQLWWERMISRLPKARGKTGLSDQMTQDEFMAVLKSGIVGVDHDGVCKGKAPFSNPLPTVNGDHGSEDVLSEILSEEEKLFLEGAVSTRLQLSEETLLCHKMISLLEMVQDRRRAAINGGRFGEDICGYDHRLDAICARDAFAAFVKSADGEEIFKASQVGDPLGEDDSVRGMCERKRCKAHAGWQKMLPLGINYQIREMASQVAELGEEEKIVREAAGERWLRKKAERNWVEVIGA